MDSITHILLGLTAIERWGATRRMSSRSVPQQWFVLIGIVVLLVLLVSLVAISYRRYQQNKSRAVEEFADRAQRRGLSTRERQILLAIAIRAGLRHTYDVFRAVEAFHRGAARLLAEYARTRTLPENRELETELVRLREKLGFEATLARRGGGAVAPAPEGSRRIPVGKTVELTGGRHEGAVTLAAEVVRNDESELVVALRQPLESRTGDPWLVRCCSGLSAWEFRTTTVRSEGQRLVLNHNELVRSINRRRFPRVAVHAPALLAHLPLVRSDVRPGELTSAGTDVPAAETVPLSAGFAPKFVESTVTEFAGPGLRIQTSLEVQVDDRILVVFRQDRPTAGGSTLRHILAAVGRVKHGRDLERGGGIPDAIDRIWEGGLPRDWDARAAQPLSIAVELTGLSNDEIDELASLACELSAPPTEGRAEPATGPQETPVPAVTTT
ncbi:MAG: hypothetical protein MUC88_07950 [Planctomycetes bacterium]|jgi:hypothetical protein|nr:hypothetical protein [Planctomycetota bacterium]